LINGDSLGGRGVEAVACGRLCGRGESPRRGLTVQDVRVHGDADSPDVEKVA